MGRGPHDDGFTLVELMITVAVIGILAAIAIPQYQHFLFRSRRAELPLNVDAIRTVELSYQLVWGAFTSCALAPSPIPGRVQEPFPATPTTDFDWNLLGWVPDGKVYGQYEVVANANVGETAGFDANGYADIDGDGNLALYTTNRADKVRLITGNTVY